MHPHEALTNAPNPILGDVSSMMPVAAPRAEVACGDGLRPDVKFETRLQALQRENRERAGQREADIAVSLANGTLWTVHAALYPGKACVVLFHGKVEDEGQLDADHPDMPAFFGPVFLIGKTHREAMFEAMKLFTVDEITIRTVR